MLQADGRPEAPLVDIQGQMTRWSRAGIARVVHASAVVS